MPARGVACATCHGPDGKGGREGNAVVPDVTYKALAAPLAAIPPARRQRPAYTDVLIARAVREGMDSSGQQLNMLMPRWALSEPELQDLIAYLKRL